MPLHDGPSARFRAALPARPLDANALEATSPGAVSDAAAGV